VGTFDRYIARSRASLELLQQIKIVAGEPVPVMLTGEAGVGKTHLVTLLHAEASRSPDRLWFVCCDEIRQEEYRDGVVSFGSLVELNRDAELRESTVVIESIDRLDAPGQAELQRWIDERERGGSLGSGRCRLVVTSRKDLQREAVAGRFSPALYYRLNTIELIVPPLRNRLEDVVPLATAFAMQTALEQGFDVPAIHPQICDMLCEQIWPGNVRQLREFVQHEIHRAGPNCGLFHELPDVVRPVLRPHFGISSPTQRGILATQD
jgi:DNA-binding NtrC family response regulator